MKRYLQLDPNGTGLTSSENPFPLIRLGLVLKNIETIYNFWDYNTRFVSFLIFALH